MKQLILTTIFSMGITANADVHLDPTTVFNLNDDSSSVQIMVAYPGKRSSGLCDIEIRSDRFTPVSLSKLLEKVNLTYAFHKEEKAVKSIGHNVLRIHLMPGTYIDGFEIATKDGSSLRKTIEDVLGTERSVVAIARTCP